MKEEVCFSTLIEAASQTARCARDLAQRLSSWRSSDSLRPSPRLTGRTALTEALLRAFITPIEREDVLLLYESLAAVYTAVVRVSEELFAQRVTTVHAETQVLVDRLRQSCDGLLEAARRLPQRRYPQRVLAPLEKLESLAVDSGVTAAMAQRAIDNVIERWTVRVVNAALCRAIDACRDAAVVWRYVVIKNA